MDKGNPNFRIAALFSAPGGGGKQSRLGPTKTAESLIAPGVCQVWPLRLAPVCSGRRASPLTINFAVVGLIFLRQQGHPPVWVVKIPGHGLAESVLQRILRLPTQL